MLRSTVVFSAMTFLSRIAGYLRDWLQASLFGAGPAVSAFVVAYRIPNYLRRIFAEGLEHLLHGGAQHRALAAVTGVAHDGLLGALLGGLDVCHGVFLKYVGEKYGVTQKKNGLRTGLPTPWSAGCPASRQEIMGDSMAWVNIAHLNGQPCGSRR